MKKQPFRWLKHRFLQKRRSLRNIRLDGTGAIVASGQGSRRPLYYNIMHNLPDDVSRNETVHVPIQLNTDAIDQFNSSRYTQLFKIHQASVQAHLIKTQIYPIDPISSICLYSGLLLASVVFFVVSTRGCRPEGNEREDLIRDRPPFSPSLPRSSDHVAEDIIHAKLLLRPPRLLSAYQHAWLYVAVIRVVTRRPGDSNCLRSPCLENFDG